MKIKLSRVFSTNGLRLQDIPLATLMTNTTDKPPKPSQLEAKNLTTNLTTDNTEN